MKRQRAMVQDMSKNLQKDIISKRVEPVDLANPSGMHVLNRNKPSAAGEDADELKRFQKIANIYERHNYIKNQIEMTK